MNRISWYGKRLQCEQFRSFPLECQQECRVPQCGALHLYFRFRLRSPIASDSQNAPSSFFKLSSRFIWLLPCSIVRSALGGMYLEKGVHSSMLNQFIDSYTPTDWRRTVQGCSDGLSIDRQRSQNSSKKRTKSLVIHTYTQSSSAVRVGIWLAATVPKPILNDITNPPEICWSPPEIYYSTPSNGEVLLWNNNIANSGFWHRYPSLGTR
jgi:hypothetical protein